MNEYHVIFILYIQYVRKIIHNVTNVNLFKVLVKVWMEEFWLIAKFYVKQAPKHYDYEITFKIAQSYIISHLETNCGNSKNTF